MLPGYNSMMQHLNLPPLTLDGTSDPLEYNQLEIDTFYLPLARFLLNKIAGTPRFVIGIGGPPACGKSAFTSLLSAVCCAVAAAPIAAAVSLDGWHYPNQYLDTHTLVRNGVEVPLRRVKGGPASFDSGAALAFLKLIRTEPRLAYPTYSRILHDPLPDGAWIEPHHHLILMEGNYLLVDQAPWDAFAALFDLSIFLTAPRAELIHSLRERHLRGGKDSAAVEKHMQFSDYPNMDLITQHSRAADITVEKADSRRIVNVTYPPAETHPGGG
jgi:pantothenate kinase